MNSATVSLSPAARLLLDILAVSGLSLAQPAWSNGLQGYARNVSVRLPADSLEAVAQELDRQGLVVCHNGQLSAAPAAVEEVLLKIRQERRAGLLASALYDDVFPLLASPFDKAYVNFRTSLLFGATRFVPPGFYPGDGGAGKPRELARISRGWKRPESFQQVDSRWQSALLEKSLEWAAEQLEEAPAAVAFLERQSSITNELLLLLGQYWFVMGNVEQTQRLARAATRIPSLPGMMAFVAGDYDGALEFFRQATLRTESPILYLPLSRLFLVMGLLRQGRPEAAELACGKESQGVDPWLRWLCDQRLGKARHPRPTLPGERMSVSEWLAAAAASLILSDRELQPGLTQQGELLMAQAHKTGFAWMATQVTRILKKFGDDKLACLPWDCVEPESTWKLRLGQLLTLTKKNLPQPRERIVWSVTPTALGWEVAAKVQGLAKKGGWSRGKTVELYRPPPSCADSFDKRVFRLALSRDCTSAEIFCALVGHPRVFHGDSGQALEVAEAQPQFQVHQVVGGLEIRIQPPCLDPQGLVVEQDGESKLKVYRYGPLLRQLSEILGNGLEIPESERATVQSLLDQLPPELSVASDLATQAAYEIEADSSLYLRVRPLREGLEMNLLVRPLGSDGPEYPPAQGGQRVLTLRRGQRIQAVRPLDRERQRRDEFLEACPALAHHGDPSHWVLPDLSASLEALEQVGLLPPQAVTVEWPEGQSLRIRHRLGSEQLRVRAEGSGDWFHLHGEVSLSPTEQWQLNQLLEQLRTASGRFIALESGEFLALTEDLRRRLQEISNLLEPSKGKSLRLHPLAAGLLQEVTSVEGDVAFQNRLLRFSQSENIQVELPGTFQAELRTYQLEGFQWLVQRAHWGVGACLADDMGLGKTLQALALLVLRAPQGPALVIAPTSVCGNWMEEARRFAPTLRVHWLAEGDRQSLIQGAEAFDVVLVSYGIVVREIELLSGRSWATLVLDEAQAIKNHATQRFQAVLKLNTDFRLVTTGTPVENRLDELWALFRFLNPGLLGSLESFRRRYIQPIEDGDVSRRVHLKKLVHPFMLRRTKSQVLHELPPRTDIQLEVRLTSSERTFYEALRTRALEKLSGGQVEAVAVLAELTRLRRACCHPYLVDKKKKSRDGSKLEVVRALLAELREEGHKALIFSQFVDHLTLLRAELDAQGIVYQYLDGSTPAQERSRRVQAFQAGQGEVFLISLRAGGFGLNLTAADYVIHMDPWWNPAVEDQASDRAHRIGQQRPVTVYRLVAKDTVEEKILLLHQHKRELVDGLLEGAEQAVRLSADELLNLMRE